MNNCPNCNYPDVDHEGNIIHMKGIWTSGVPCAYCGETLIGEMIKCISQSETSLLYNETYCGKKINFGVNVRHYFNGLVSVLNKKNHEHPCPDCIAMIKAILEKVS